MFKRFEKKHVRTVFQRFLIGEKSQKKGWVFQCLTDEKKIVSRMKKGGVSIVVFPP